MIINIRADITYQVQTRNVVFYKQKQQEKGRIFRRRQLIEPVSKMIVDSKQERSFAKSYDINVRAMLNSFTLEPEVLMLEIRHLFLVFLEVRHSNGNSIIIPLSCTRQYLHCVMK